MSNSKYFEDWLEDVEYSLTDLFGVDFTDLDIDPVVKLRKLFEEDYDCEDVALRLGHTHGLKERD